MVMPKVYEDYHVRIEREREEAKKFLKPISYRDVIEEMDKYLLLDYKVGKSVRFNIHHEPYYTDRDYFTQIHLTKRSDGSLYTNNKRVSTARLALPDPSVDKLERKLNVYYLVSIVTRNVILNMVRENNPGLSSIWYWPVQYVSSGWIRGAGKELRGKLNGMDKYREFENAVRSLLDSEAYELARNARGGVNLEQYNKVIKNKNSIQQLIETNPGATGWFLNSKDTGKNKYNHPGELIKTIRPLVEKAGIDKKYWKTISQIPTDSMMLMAKHNIANYKKAILLNACGETHAKPSIECMKSAIHLLDICFGRWGAVSRPSKNETDEQRKGRETLIKVFKLLFVADAKDDADLRQINEISDYVRDSIRNGESINSTTWGGLLKASNRWHREITRQRLEESIQKERAENNGWIRAWNSLIDSCDVTIKTGESFKIKPLVTPLELIEEGRRMRHCVGTYDDLCLKGAARIFSILNRRYASATVEIRQSSGRWRVKQIKSYHNSKASDDMLEAARMVAKMYDDKYKDGFHKKHYFHPETGAIVYDIAFCV